MVENEKIIAGILISFFLSIVGYIITRKLFTSRTEVLIENYGITPFDRFKKKFGIWFTWFIFLLFICGHILNQEAKENEIKEVQAQQKKSNTTKK